VLGSACCNFVRNLLFVACSCLHARACAGARVRIMDDGARPEQRKRIFAPPHSENHGEDCRGSGL